jgi:hypothetical protein
VYLEKAIANLVENFKLNSNADMTALNTNDTEMEPNLTKVLQAEDNRSAHIESLTISKDKTLTNSQFISISLTSMMENESQYRQ